MESLPNDILSLILEFALSFVSDLTQVKNICSINKRFANICRNDHLWYLVYTRNIDPEVNFNKPIYITWKKSILESKTAFTTDKLIHDEVIDFLQFESDHMTEKLDIIRLDQPIVLIIFSYLEKYGTEKFNCPHIFQAFWWRNPDTFEIMVDPLLSQINTFLYSKKYVFYMDKIRLEHIINPYGKLHSYKRYNNTRIMDVRKLWRNY